MGKLIGTVLLMMVFLSIAMIHAESSAENSTGNFTIFDFSPKEVLTGDVQFSIAIENNKSDPPEESSIIVSGKGFSMDDVVLISFFGNKSIVFVYGKAKETGNIALTININGKEYLQDIVSFNATGEKKEELIAIQEKENLIENLSVQLDKLSRDLNEIEKRTDKKRDEDYDVSPVDIEHLKNYIIEIQESLFNKETEGVEDKIKEAYQEYSVLEENLKSVKKVSFTDKAKDYAKIILIISATVLIVFLFYELAEKRGKRIKELIERRIKKKNT